MAYNAESERFVPIRDPIQGKSYLFEKNYQPNERQQAASQDWQRKALQKLVDQEYYPIDTEVFSIEGRAALRPAPSANAKLRIIDFTTRVVKEVNCMVEAPTPARGLTSTRKSAHESIYRQERQYPTAREGEISPFEQKILADIAEIQAARIHGAVSASRVVANAQERMLTMYTQ